jgi:hypothetical protein
MLLNHFDQSRKAISVFLFLIYSSLFYWFVLQIVEVFDWPRRDQLGFIRDLEIREPEWLRTFAELKQQEEDHQQVVSLCHLTLQFFMLVYQEGQLRMPCEIFFSNE